MKVRTGLYASLAIVIVGINQMDAAGVGPAYPDWIWGLKSHDEFSEPPTTLFRFQADGTFVTVGQVILSGADVDADALAMDAYETLYAYVLDTSAGTSQLVQLDLETAAATAVGPVLSGREMRGAAFDAQGRLLVLDAVEDQLLQINPSTGAVIEMLYQLTDVTNCTDITQQIDGSYMLTDADMLKRLFLDVNGVFTEFWRDELPDDGSPIYLAGISICDAMPDPELLYAYDVSREDDVMTYEYTYVPDDRVTRSELISDLIPAYNAGRGDLAAMPATLLRPYPLSHWSADSGGNGHWYRTVRVLGGINWDEARDVAADRGGHLATLHSAQENTFCYNLINEDPNLWYFDTYHSGIGPWIGGYELGEGTWRWITGEAWTYAAWAPGEPNNLGGHEAYLHFFSNSGALMNDDWNDIGRNIMIHGFIIEWSQIEPPQPMVVELHDTPMGWELTWPVGVGNTYQLMRGSDLQGWSPIETMSPEMNYLYRFTDALGGVSNPVFYRVKRTVIP